LTTIPFEIAAGSIVGRDHRLVPKNCQDGIAVHQSDGIMVGVVTDGCGSQPHSEVGAKLGASLVCEAVRAEASFRGAERLSWQRVRQHVLASLDVLVRQMGGNYRRKVEEYFLFTIVGVLVLEQMTTFFAFGDGVVIINGQQNELGPFTGNQPPYVSYGLLGDSVDIDEQELRLNIVSKLPTDELEHFLIGCDGVIDLINATDKNLPGLDALVGPIGQFWERDRYFGNTELVSRQLKLIGRDWPKKDPEPGLLPDDTTLIVGRRALAPAV
jgi:hypothetical protein